MVGRRCDDGAERLRANPSTGSGRTVILKKKMVDMRRENCGQSTNNPTGFWQIRTEHGINCDLTPVF